MSAFKAAMVHILDIEKGYSDRKADRGGPTNYGISTRAYSAFLGRPASPADVRAMPASHAEKIYRMNYWDTLKLDLISEFPIQLVLFDQAVNRGPMAAVKTLQSVIGIHEDGILGPITRAKILAFRQDFVVYSFLMESIAAYVRIAQSDPSQNANLMGWLNRVRVLMDAFLLPEPY